MYIEVKNTIFVLPCAHEIRNNISSTKTTNCDRDASSLYKEQYYPKCNSSTKINEDMCKIMNKGVSKEINWNKYNDFYANGFRSPNYSYSRRRCRDTNLIKVALEFLDIVEYTIDEITTIPPPPLISPPTLSIPNMNNPNTKNIMDLINKTELDETAKNELFLSIINNPNETNRRREIQELRNTLNLSGGISNKRKKTKRRKSTKRKNKPRRKKSRRH